MWQVIRDGPKGVQIVRFGISGLNDGDAEGLGALFTEDALFVNIAGMRMAGRDGIVDGHRWALAGPLKGSPLGGLPCSSSAAGVVADPRRRMSHQDLTSGSGRYGLLTGPGQPPATRPEPHVTAS